MKDKYLAVYGAREHNLKNITVKIPRNTLTVITGLSGSGKSTLAFDTIYAEGQRRYVESLSSYARQFLEKMHKPEVDHIDGLSPAISIEQKTVSKNPRSTVGTVTEIHDYFRILFASIGKPYCYNCGKPITSLTTQGIVDTILKLGVDKKISLLAPIVRKRKGEYLNEFRELKQKGFLRVKVDGAEKSLDEDIKLDKNKKHDIDVFVDQLKITEKSKDRMTDSIETILKLSQGLVKVELSEEKKSYLYNQKSACIDCEISYPEINPQMFSFNSPQGACPECSGLGKTIFFDETLVVPDASKSIMEGSIRPWGSRTSNYYYQMIAQVAAHYDFDLEIPFNDLSKTIQNIVLHGSGDTSIDFELASEEGGYAHKFSRPYEGVIPNLKRRYSQTDSEYIRSEIEKFMTMQICTVCGGKRLKKESLHIKINNTSIYDLEDLAIKDSFAFFDSLSLTKKEIEISVRITKEIKSRLKFLIDVGLDYLTLGREAGTLSGGESQRIRLATQIGSNLVGVLYILDEPSIGLHQKDNERLITTLMSLKELGNTVIVVEHDRDIIEASDFIVDLGPGAGIHGGHIVHAGTVAALKSNTKSITGAYLEGKKRIERTADIREGNGKYIEVLGATGNNLKNVNVTIPLGKFICVTGVSGSGKSTLIIETLYKYLAHYFYSSREKNLPFKKINGVEYIDKVIDVDQSPIGRTPRSNPVTYTGVFSYIRELFSELKESKIRGYKPGRFSFNVSGGRCEVCEGDGVIKIEMHFLPDVYVECDSCNGKRYNRETLEIHYKAKNIHEVLSMTIAEAFSFFENIPTIKNRLQTLKDVGLGYICLGQAATTLSGGESQRIKLARELAKRATGKTLYILDEPTTGLHFDDIRKLLEVLHRLTNSGNTIMVIEHNLDVIKCADYIIDLGPDGGDNGGTIVAEGTPEEVAHNSKSYTGKFLKKMLNMC